MANKRSAVFCEDMTLDLANIKPSRPPLPPKPRDIVISQPSVLRVRHNPPQEADTESRICLQHIETTDASRGVDDSGSDNPELHNGTPGLENSPLTLRRQGGVKSRIIGRTRSGIMSRGLRQLVAPPRESQGAYTGPSKINGFGPGYENTAKARESIGSSGTSFDSEDMVEENPAYRTVTERRSIRSSSGSSEADCRRYGMPEYLDLLDDTEEDPDAEQDADPDDIYEYCWNSDEFSDDENGDAIYGNAYDDEENAISTTLEIHDAELEARLMVKRRRVMEEIASSESAYIDRLFVLLRTSFQLEGANMIKAMYPSNQHNQMFPSMEVLFRLHAENILPSIRNRLEHWTCTPVVVDIWKKYIPFLAIYKQYASMFAEAVTLIQKHKKSSEDFANFIKNIEKKGEFRKLSLENLMLEPVQRIARYKLLLEAYARSLRPVDEELEPLKDVIETIDRQIRECQQLLSAKEVLGDFQKVQDRLDDVLSVLNPTSKLLKEGGVTEVTIRGSRRSLHQRYIFLFSDFILICSKKLNGKYSINLQLDASELRIRQADDLIEAGYSAEVCMLLKGREKIVSLVFQDSSIKEDWEEMLLYAITVQLGHRIRTLSDKRKIHDVVAPSGNCAKFSRAPTWVSDESASGCMVCSLKFKKLVRYRHHCRGCGIVVCNKCSSQKMALPYMNNDVARVCDNCFLRGRETLPELTRNVSIRRNIKRSSQETERVNLHRSQAYGAEESET